MDNVHPTQLNTTTSYQQYFRELKYKKFDVQQLIFAMQPTSSKSFCHSQMRGRVSKADRRSTFPVSSRQS